MDELEPYPGQGPFAVASNLQPMVACLDRPGEVRHLWFHSLFFRHHHQRKKKKTFLNHVSQVWPFLSFSYPVLFVNFVGVDWKEEGKKEAKI